MKTLLSGIVFLLALLIGIGGVAGGIYLGVWYGLVGGIIAVIEAAKATPIPAPDMAWGIARVVFAGLMGWGTLLVSWTCAAALFAFAGSLNSGYGSRRRW